MSSFSSNDDPSPKSSGPNGLALIAFMGAGMLIGILFLSWLGTPRVPSSVGQALGKLDLQPLAYADQPLTEASLQGKVTLLHFWGTWCPPCRQEFPEFVKVAETFAGNADVQVISVSSSQGPEYDLDKLASETRAFMETHNAKVPTYSDSAGLSRAQAGMLLPDGALPYPATFVLDRSGQVVRVWLGYKATGMEEVAKTIKSML